MDIILNIWLGFMAWALMSLLWLRRERWLYYDRLHNPWGEAIDRDDGPACDYWYTVGKNYPLLKARIILNPIAWIRYWNWRPPEFVSREFPAGTYKKGQEFDIQ